MYLALNIKLNLKREFNSRFLYFVLKLYFRIIELTKKLTTRIARL